MSRHATPVPRGRALRAEYHQYSLQNYDRELKQRRYQVMRARDQRILAGKRDSRRHSTTGFRENVVVTEKSYY